jgi:hypothetical protein
MFKWNVLFRRSLEVETFLKSAKLNGSLSLSGILGLPKRDDRWAQNADRWSPEPLLLERSGR